MKKESLRCFFLGLGAYMPTPNLPAVELATRRIGQDLAQRSSSHIPSVFNRRWWTGSLLAWCMKDEHFKVQLFRFIDVLPSLKRHTLVAQVVEDYFSQPQVPTSPLHWALRLISGTRAGAYLSARSLRRHIHQMAYSFIAGATVQDALPVLAQMWKDKRGYSIDLLGEAIVSEREADHYRDRCLEALALLGEAGKKWPAIDGFEHDHLGPLPRISLSIKLSALYSQLDPIDPEGGYRAVSDRLRPILDLAVKLPAAITFDMEQAEMKNITFMIFKRVFSEPIYKAYPYAGIAIQAYLKETSKDLESLIQWIRQRGTPIMVRLVKGAYWDADMIRYHERGWSVPVFEEKAATDANYEFLCERLVQHASFIRPAFGTHNLRSLAHAAAVAEKAGLPPEAYEFQMIFGMAEPLQAAVVGLPRRVRIYTPIGEVLPGMAYLVRRLLENTSNESFLRQEYVESKNLDDLLAPPANLLTKPRVSGNGSSLGTVTKAQSFPTRFVNEPPTDFSLDTSREAMLRALATVKSQFGHTHSYPGSPGTLSTNHYVISHNPSLPCEVVGRVPVLDLHNIDHWVRTAHSAYSSWKAVSIDQRVAILRKAAGIMREERFVLAAWEVFETGKPWREADGDIAEAIDFLEFYACQMIRFGKPQRLGKEPGELNHLSYVPCGLVLVISPWNFPLAIPTGLVSAALVTGNVVLFKPSERSPIMGVHLARIFKQAGLPEGVLQMIPGGPDVGQALVTHPAVQVIAFTGSKEVGLHILAQAGQVQPEQRFVKRVIAEMGGKNAIIVDETADLDEAVMGVVYSFSGFQGQKCSACSRAIIQESIYDQFLSRLSEAVVSLRIGPPEDPAHSIGPMIDERALDKVRQYIAIGKQEGRMLVERTIDGPGFFIGPAVFADIQPEDRLAQEEIFGPVLAVMPAQSFDEAIRIANDTSYALTGGVYSRSPLNIRKACELYDVGNLYINRPITGSLVGRQPFGGHRLSGVGAKAGGEDYLTQFMHARVVSENTLRRGFAPTM